MKKRLEDISKIHAQKISLRKNSQVFFFMNRSLPLEFFFEKAEAGADIFALFLASGSESFSTKIHQIHRAPDTVSRLSVLSILGGSASFSYEGRIRIDKGAIRSNASQENRNVLLSNSARAQSNPTLEILEDDVVARHASATGGQNEEARFFLASRGLADSLAKRALAEGRIREFFGNIRSIAESESLDELETESMRLLETIFSENQ